MSLRKIMQVSCDSAELLMSRLYADEGTTDDYRAVLAASREDRHALTLRCRYGAAEAFNVKDARQKADDAGWVRHRETVRKYYGTDQTERRTFDLCPVCAPNVVDQATELAEAAR
ncbi:hypothetical protein ACXJJ3_26765 [Kribbella sp. WER1]